MVGDKMKKKITILLPCYKASKHIDQCLSCLFKQNYEDFKLIIIMDGPDELCEKKCIKFMEKHDSIAMVKLPKQIGVNNAINRAIPFVKTKYLFILAADDHLINPTFFQKAINFFEVNPDAPMLFTNLATTKDFASIEKHQNFIPTGTRFLTVTDTIKIYNQTRFNIGSNTVMYRTSIYKKIGGHDPMLEQLADWFLNYQLAFTYGVGYINIYSVARRIHNNSYSNQVNFKKKYNIIKILMNKKTNKGIKNYREIITESNNIPYNFINAFIFYSIVNWEISLLRPKIFFDIFARKIWFIAIKPILSSHLKIKVKQKALHLIQFIYQIR